MSTDMEGVVRQWLPYISW